MPSEFDISILHQAVKENINIFIKKDSRREKPTYYSRFLDYSTEENTILIDIPTLAQEGKLLKKNDKMRVFFVYKNTRFVIHSTILGRKKFQLHQDKIIPSLIISMPEKLFNGERRDYFRAPTPPYLAEISLETKKTEEPETYYGIIVDIAGCGIGIKEDQHHIPLKMSDKVNLKINLGDDILLVKGWVKNKIVTPDSTKVNYGIEFDHEKSGPMGVNKNIRKIMKYVVKRQREMIN